MTLPKSGAVFLVILSLAVCTGEAGNERAAPSALDPARIAALSDTYPRLGTEPLPEPEVADASLETSHGQATYYANAFEGRRTASGIPFRHNQFVAAHRAYPFGTILRVTNTTNDRSVRVRVVDRGPFGDAKAAQRPIIDLSRRAAEAIGSIQAGRVPVSVEVLQWGRGLG